VLLGTAFVAGAIYLAWRRPAPAATGPVPPGSVPPGSGPVPPATGSAEAALAERFARGDIDADEYRDRLAVLREHLDGRPAPCPPVPTPAARPRGRPARFEPDMPARTPAAGGY